MQNILLLFGGKSFEHDISIITALIVKNQYKLGKFNIIPVYITKNNEWFYFSKQDLNINMFKDFEQKYKQNGFIPCYLKMGQNYLFFKKGLFENKIEISGALNCCHGGQGENGTICSIIENSAIPVSAGSHTGHGICMDKILSKAIFKGLGIPCLPWLSVEKQNFENQREQTFKNIEKFGFPVILKPATLGSSIGIEVVKEVSELENALKVAFEFEDKILIERAVLDNMKEYNVACLRLNGETIVSEIDKPLRKDEILSFKDKYIGDSNQLPSKQNNLKQKAPSKSGATYLGQSKTFPAQVPEKIARKLKDISKQIYENLDLFGPARIDFIVDKKNNVYLNEINSIPGSLAYYFFVPSHFKTMSEYVDKIIDESINVFTKKSKIKKEFITNLIK